MYGLDRYGPYSILMAYSVMAYIVMAYIAYIVMAYTVMAFSVMAYIGMPIVSWPRPPADRQMEFLPRHADTAVCRAVSLRMSTRMSTHVPDSYHWRPIYIAIYI